MRDGQYKRRLRDIISSWRATGRPSTRKALSDNPDLDSKDAFMDLVLAEFKMRRESGEQLVVTRFCDQFSTYRDELRALLHVEQGVAKYEEENRVRWPHEGDTFLEFELQSLLGVGAASRVYLARQTTLGNRLVALKITPFGSSEAQTLGKLRHRNVVPVLSIHDDPERKLWAVCMPYLGSATLLDVRNHAFKEQRVPLEACLVLDAASVSSAPGAGAKEEPPLVLRSGRYYEAIAYIGAELAEGLAYTHSQGVLHRDLKPSNVLITSDGCPMLLDFNLAWDAQRESIRLGGTFPYMPPEQIYATFLAEDGDVEQPDDPRSDVFALGVILFELLTGRLPFPIPDDVDASEMLDELVRLQLLGAPQVREFAPHVPRRLAKVVEQCLVVEISGRPQPTQLAQQLRRVGIRPQLQGKRSRWMTAAAAVLFAAVVFGGTATLMNLDARQDAQSAPNIVDTREEYLQRAMKLLEQGEFAEAATGFKTANQLEPHWTVAAYEAYCYCLDDNILQAKAILNQLIQEGHVDPSILNNYARIQLNNNEYDIAKGYLDRALLLDSNHPNTLLNLSYYCLRFPEDGGARAGVNFALSALESFKSRPISLAVFAADQLAGANSQNILDQNEANEYTRRLLNLAAQGGCLKQLVEMRPAFAQYSSEGWYKALLANSKAELDSTPIQDLYYSAPSTPAL